MHIMCVCLFNALSRRAGALQMSFVIIIYLQGWPVVVCEVHWLCLIVPHVLF